MNLLILIRQSIHQVINAFQDVINIAKLVGDAFGKAGSAIGSTWNAIVGYFKSGINEIIGLINTFINALDSISIHMPSINIPGGGTVGGGTLSFPHIPDIPYLAAGGIVQSSGLAVVGDAGPELLSLPIGASVTPLSSSGSSQQPVNQTIVLQVDGKNMGPSRPTDR